MLKRVMKDAVKSPWKLLGICLVLYIASMSMFVAGAIGLMVLGHFRNEHRRKLKAIHAAEIEAQAEADAQAKADAQAAVRAKSTKRQAAANDATQPSAPTQTEKQYAKSAVVVPFKTGSR